MQPCEILGWYRRLRFSSDADNVRLTNACIIIIILFFSAQGISDTEGEEKIG